MIIGQETKYSESMQDGWTSTRVCVSSASELSEWIVKQNSTDYRYHKSDSFKEFMRRVHEKNKALAEWTAPLLFKFIDRKWTLFPFQETAVRRIMFDFGLGPVPVLKKPSSIKTAVDDYTAPEMPVLKDFNPLAFKPMTLFPARVVENEVPDWMSEIIHDLETASIPDEGPGYRKTFRTISFDMGLGKTLTSLSLFDLIYQSVNKPNLSLLVVCPKSVMPVWAEQVMKHAPDLDEAGLVLIQSYPSIRRPRKDKSGAQKDGFVDKVAALDPKPFFLIFDEAHTVKNSTAQVTEEAYRLASLPNCIGGLMLTGTPITNKPVDMYSLFRFCGPDIYGSFRQFHLAHVATVDRRFGGRPKTFKNLENLAARFGEIAVRARKTDVMADLPDKTFTLREVLMDTWQAGAYKLAKEGFRMAFMEARAGDTPQEKFKGISNVAVQLTRLRQIADGINPASEPQQMQAHRKIDSALDLISSNDEQFVVFGDYLLPLKMLAAKLDEAGIPCGLLIGELNDRERALHYEEFKNGNHRVLLCQSQTGGFGLDLSNCHNVIFIDRPWSYGTRIQNEDRIHRIGQANACTYIDLVTKYTIDLTMLDMLRRKGDWFERATDMQKYAKILEALDSETVDVIYEDEDNREIPDEVFLPEEETT